MVLLSDYATGGAFAIRRGNKGHLPYFMDFGTYTKGYATYAAALDTLMLLLDMRKDLKPKL